MKKQTKKLILNYLPCFVCHETWFYFPIFVCHELSGQQTTNRYSKARPGYHFTNRQYFIRWHSLWWSGWDDKCLSLESRLRRDGPCFFCIANSVTVSCKESTRSIGWPFDKISGPASSQCPDNRYFPRQNTMAKVSGSLVAGQLIRIIILAAIHGQKFQGYHHSILLMQY